MKSGIGVEEYGKFWRSGVKSKEVENWGEMYCVGVGNLG